MWAYMYLEAGGEPLPGIYRARTYQYLGLTPPYEAPPPWSHTSRWDTDWPILSKEWIA